LLSELAIRYLFIPATSAPSERAFSSAGLTIAKEWSHLDPATANELVFLHEITPAWQQYKGGIDANNNW
jgi:Leucine-rich repeat (LRR) protein